MALNIFFFYWVICAFSTKKKVKVNHVIIVFYYLGEKHSVNLKQITCVAMMFVTISRCRVIHSLRNV